MIEESLIILLLILTLKKISLLTGIICFIVVSVYIRNKFSTTIKFHMVKDENDMNEAIILEAILNEKYNTLFMLDTGYAGPPVLSSSYLHIQHKCSYGSVLQRYRKSLKLIRKGISEDDRNNSINKLIMDGKCQSFTSGCTMKLVGIGSVVEQQADMLLCPMISFKNSFGFYVKTKNSQKVDADVLVSNPLPTSVNILTCDYLMHSLPVLIDMKNELLTLNMTNLHLLSEEGTFIHIPLKTIGGAPVIPIVLGGVELEVTVDTGAPGPVCLGKNSASKLEKCWKSKNSKKILQKGVNGEKICSDIYYSSLTISNIHFDSVGVFSNNKNVEDVDGYIGLGVLRSLNLLFLPNSIGIKKSGLDPRQSFNFASNGDCGEGTLTCLTKK